MRWSCRATSRPLTNTTNVTTATPSRRKPPRHWNHLLERKPDDPIRSHLHRAGPLRCVLLRGDCRAAAFLCRLRRLPQHGRKPGARAEPEGRLRTPGRHDGRIYLQPCDEELQSNLGRKIARRFPHRPAEEDPRKRDAVSRRLGRKAARRDRRLLEDDPVGVLADHRTREGGLSSSRERSVQALRLRQTPRATEYRERGIDPSPGCPSPLSVTSSRRDPFA